MNHKETLPVFLIDIKDLLTEDTFNNIVENKFLTKSCRKCGIPLKITYLEIGRCKFYFITFYTWIFNNELYSCIIGDIACFEISYLNSTDRYTELSRIPTILKGQDEIKYLLIGLIDYDGPEKMLNSRDIGHYTSIRYVCPGWICYDDLSDSPKNLKSCHKTNIKLIFYYKTALDSNSYNL